MRIPHTLLRTPLRIKDSMLPEFSNKANIIIVKSKNTIKGIPHIPPVNNSFLKSGFPENAFNKKVNVDIRSKMMTIVIPIFKKVANSIKSRAWPANKYRSIV